MTNTEASLQSTRSQSASGDEENALADDDIRSSDPGSTASSVELPDTMTTMASDETPASASAKLNVLFLVSDDLRPQVESYKGANYPNPRSRLGMYTPHLDRLAGRGLQLDSAYVQFSVCSPSRASYMTGRRPDTTHVWDLVTFWREAGGNFTTIPQYFKERGYRTAGFGKIYHPGRAGGDNDVPLSWTEPYFAEPNGLFYQTTNDSWWAVPEELSATKPLHDEAITTAAIELLAELAPEARSGRRPFFVAVGFQKPHIPFVFPERYLRRYPESAVDLAPNPYAPIGFPKIAWFHIEGNDYDDIRATGISGSEVNETLPEQTALVYRRAYFACVSFVDDMVGRLLKALDDLDLAGNTIVTFVGDHGFHLGENGMWGKHTNMEQATHAPMIIHVPDRTPGGARSEALVEFVDLFPTLVELAGLDPVPACPAASADVRTCTEGRSFASLLDDPGRSFKRYALSQMNRERAAGYALRSARFRYVEWPRIRKKSVTETKCVRVLDWDNVIARELYDHRLDPEENHNVVESERYQGAVARMSEVLRQMVPTSLVTSC